MKYIEYPELTHLSRALTHDSSECTVHTRIEAYTTKSITREKRLWKNLEHTYAEEQAAANSPPDSFLSGDYPFGPGPLDKSARKTQYLLIATLNAAFPDHDFSELRPDHFCKETDGAGVLNALSTTLESLRDRPGNSIGGPAAAQPRSYSSYPPTSSDFFPSSVPTSSSPVSSFGAKQTPTIISGTHPTLYRMLDDIISLAECEVFSYVPDLESDPHAGAESDDEGSSSEEDSEDVDDDDDDTFGFGGVKESWRERWPSSRPRFSKNTLDDDESSPHSFTAPIPIPVRRRSRGGLLWSSHWFFHNKKQKRLLFVSVWARNKSTVPQSVGWGAVADAERETFFGWEGAAGAGARAFASGMGLDN